MSLSKRFKEIVDKENQSETKAREFDANQLLDIELVKQFLRIEDDEDAAANILLPLSNPIVPFDQPPLSGLIPCCSHRGSFKIAERIRSIISNACDSLFARTAIVLSLLNRAYHKI